MTFVTVWGQDFMKSERLPFEVVTLLQEQGTIRPGWKPNKRGKLKPCLISIYSFSKVRDLSCQMGPRVIERAIIDGCEHHKAIVKEWRPKFAVVLAC